MSSPHDQTDQYFDELLNHNLYPNVDALDEDDTEILQSLVILYRSDTIPSSTKYSILNKAHEKLYNKDEKTILRPSYKKQIWRLVAVFASIVGILFLINGLQFEQYSTQLHSPTPLVEEIALIPTVYTSDLLLLRHIPQLSPAFGFEYGGYIASDTQQYTLDNMKGAGIVWVAFSVKHSTETDVSRIHEQINVAQQQGFKVLISVQGSKTALENLPQSYLQSYTDFVAQFVHAGADAIEIWQDANIDRSWSMKLGVDGYARLLTETIAVVRELNPEVLIISGAPAPTGAESAFEGRVINDDNFLRQLMNQGALNGVDCVGMHYVEGAVPPLDVSGDNRDDDYRRYLPTMIQTYREVVGAQIPICVTSIGYFSGDGLSDIPQFFEWAKIITRQDQNLWLIEAIEWLSLQVDVPLAMIWHINLDQDKQDNTLNQIYRGYALSR